jgi:chemotaxis signal transduction protein
MSAYSEVWLLDCGQGSTVAVPAANMLHVVDDASLCFRVPMAPAHCDRVLVWQKRVLPIVDARRLLYPAVDRLIHEVFCVLGWSIRDDETEYGVITTIASPRRAVVRDDQCTAPTTEQAALWRSHALCVFAHQGTAIPIVDPASLFGSRQWFGQVREGEGVFHANDRIA